MHLVNSSASDCDDATTTEGAPEGGDCGTWEASRVVGVFSALSVFVLALLLITDLLDKSGDLPTLLSMHLSLAQTFLAGSKPYLDYFDFSPPLVFEFAKLPYLLQAALGTWLPMRIESFTKV
ncbi:MAG TPA: hypothetical protein PKN86_21550, partial [Candidatus Obscuribacter sp.]|nr:hypothetical protein [Candidatus Obscuribacter sp.]